MKLLLCLVLLSLASSVAYAAPAAQGWPEGSAMSVGQTFAQQRDATEKRLARSYEVLLKLVAAGDMLGDASYETGQALKAEQKVWFKYRDAECDLVGALTGAGGTWPSTYAVRCERNLTTQRLRRVKSAIRCVRLANKKGSWLEGGQASCLQQLAPIANRI